eukprot:scaffold3.g6174.t1
MALPEAQTAACCPSSHDAHTGQAEELELLSLDPTLESCCRRDLEERARAERIKAELSLHDRSTVREALRQQVVGAPPRGAAADAGGLEGEGEEGDAELARLRTVRLQQMQQEAQHKAELQQRGLGSLASVPEADLLATARRAEQSVVVHLAYEGVEVGDVLDEHLGSLAHRFLGTRFLRVRVSPRSTLHLRLGAPPRPSLVCLWEGSVIGAIGLDCFGAPESIAEEEVDRWLRQRHVLHTPESLEAWAAAQRQGGAGMGPLGGAARGSESDSDDGGSGSDWQLPCEVCGRRYPHQHVRSMYADRPSDSEEDDIDR